MTQWRDEHGYRYFDPIRLTVQVVPYPGPPQARTKTPNIDEALLRELCEETRTVR